MHFHFDVFQAHVMHLILFEFCSVGPDVPTIPVGQDSQENIGQSGFSFESHDIEADQSNYRTKADVEFGAKDLNLGVKLRNPDDLADGDDIVKIIKLADGTKQLFFRFDKLKQDNKEPVLEEVYDELRKVLYKKTNFQYLEHQSTYLTVIVKLLQAAYFGKGVDVQTQSTFQALANELEFLDNVKDFGGDREDSTDEILETTNENRNPVQDWSEEIHITGDDIKQQIKVLNVNGVGVKIKTRVVNPVPENSDHSIKQSYADENDFEEVEISSDIPAQDSAETAVDSDKAIEDLKMDLEFIDEDTEDLGIDSDVDSAIYTETLKYNQHNQDSDTTKSEKDKMKFDTDPGDVNVAENDVSDHVEIIENELDYSELEDFSSELVDGLKRVIENTEEIEYQTGSGVHETRTQSDSDNQKASQSQEVPKFKKPRFEKTVKSLKQNEKEEL